MTEMILESIRSSEDRFQLSECNSALFGKLTSH
jgi:hypothetical protein